MVQHKIEFLDRIGEKYSKPFTGEFADVKNIIRNYYLCNLEEVKASIIQEDHLSNKGTSGAIAALLLYNSKPIAAFGGMYKQLHILYEEYLNLNVRVSKLYEHFSPIILDKIKKVECKNNMIMKYNDNAVNNPITLMESVYHYISTSYKKNYILNTFHRIVPMQITNYDKYETWAVLCDKHDYIGKE